MSTSGAVVVIGQGYVGLPLAMRAVEAGYDVIGLDADAGRVKRLGSGQSYVEDISDEEVAAAVATGRYRATTDYADCAGFSVAVVTVPTPLREGTPDLSHIEESVRALAPQLTAGATVVLESTTYPGTTEELVGPLLEEGSGLAVGRDFHLGYSPERIDPGNPTWRFANTPKVVSGVDAASLEAVAGFYASVVERVVPVSSPAVAETTKLLENTFRHVNIALVNELAMFASDLGIDVWEAIEAASSKPFGFMPFRPGPGVGGHCLPIDPSYLSWRVKRRLGQSFRFVELANDVNEHMPDYVARRLTAAFNRQRRAVNGSRVLVLGLAYKPNTGDARESPATVVVERLLGLGAEVLAADPHVEESHVDARVQRVDDPVAAAADVDAVVLVVDHADFPLEDIAAAARYVLDTRHRLAPAPHVEYL
ncbi:nucleotide sugar dehydrogenase [Acidimicrobiaceae bacterium USS-CC1]|uniref:Nucleotide sugar dehydrogenase n=1 Tax=Acidiferrimicrobium australe TaxID=2664430 RepID=A0ABW9QQJ7_9ACTN|nr:nucleotide sugar dehydrogenase [Acidiferrimicrobium australe]